MPTNSLAEPATITIAGTKTCRVIRHGENPDPSLPLGRGKRARRNGRRSQVCRRTAPTATSTRFQKRARRQVPSRADSTWISKVDPVSWTGPRWN